MMARNLEITHHVDDVVRDVDDNVRAARDGAQCFLTLTVHVPFLIVSK